jgi:membrane associated rhomboid family serine protease
MQSDSGGSAVTPDTGHDGTSDGPLLADGTVVVGVFRSPKRAHEAGLLILAMGLAYWLMPGAEGGNRKYFLCVEKVHADRVRQAMGADGHSRMGTYLRRRRRPAGTSAPSPFSCSWWHFLALPMWLLSIHFLIPQARLDLLQMGTLDSVLVRSSGQWWRLLTALTLHADVPHLLGNLLFGSLLLRWVFLSRGAGVGWLLVLGSGFLGNAVSVLLHVQDLHRSIGASTAVFGALGLLVSDALLRRHEGLLPASGVGGIFLAGVAVLGLWGSGGVNTDVVAHACGFVCGCGIGWFSGLGNGLFSGLASQRVAGVMAFVLPFVAWTFALFSLQ